MFFSNNLLQPLLTLQGASAAASVSTPNTFHRLVFCVVSAHKTLSTYRPVVLMLAVFLVGAFIRSKSPTITVTRFLQDRLECDEFFSVRSTQRIPVKRI